MDPVAIAEARGLDQSEVALLRADEEHVLHAAIVRPRVTDSVAGGRYRTEYPLRPKLRRQCEKQSRRRT
jgi:hypothetical protein